VHLGERCSKHRRRARGSCEHGAGVRRRFVRSDARKSGNYERVSFHVPSEPAEIYALKRDDAGKSVGRDAVLMASL